MLKVYVGDFNEEYIKKDDKFIDDVCAEFGKLQLGGTELERAAIRDIEMGEWKTKTKFIDRFGVTLYNTELSTGCKAALVVLNRKDNIINLTEAGVNVRDFLLKYCKDGAVYIPHLDATVSSYVNDVNKGKEIFDLQIEVCLDGKVFEDIESINAYIMNPFMYA